LRGPRSRHCREAAAAAVPLEANFAGSE